MTCPVRRWRTPRWTASQVTSSPAPSRPLVLPPTARSWDRPVERVWASTSRMRSKQRSIGAAMKVSRRMVGRVVSDGLVSGGLVGIGAPGKHGGDGGLREREPH